MTNELPTVPATSDVVPKPTIKTVVVPLSKPVFKSWTMWFNIISAIIVILNQISPFSNVFIHDPMVAKNVSDVISAVIVLGNVLLRFRTNAKVTLS